MAQGLLELGETLMSVSQRRLESVASNIANSATPGFRSERIYEEVLASQTNARADHIAAERRVRVATDFRPASLRQTGAPLDLALAGAGFFVLRDGEGAVYTRSAHFERDSDGRLVDAAGRALQAAGGGDIFIANSSVEILSDGVVMQDDVPLARIAVLRPQSPDDLVARTGAIFVAAADDDMQAVDEPIVRQGMIEGSNVETADEMLQMMTAVRQAETGARVVQAYDTLMGQAITTLGRVER